MAKNRRFKQQLDKSMKEKSIKGKKIQRKLQWLRQTLNCQASTSWCLPHSYCSLCGAVVHCQALGSTDPCPEPMWLHLCYEEFLRVISVTYLYWSYLKPHLKQAICCPCWLPGAVSENVSVPLQLPVPLEREQGQRHLSENNNTLFDFSFVTLS